MDGATGPAASSIVQKPSGSIDRVTKVLVSIKPLGYVVKADGEFTAIISQDDEIYIVRQGDRFAGRYRAVSVSADAVEAVEEPPTQVPRPPFAAPPVFPGLLSASAQEGPSQFSHENCQNCNSHESGEVSRRLPGDAPAEVASHPSRKREVKRARTLTVKWPWRRFAHAVKQAAVTADTNRVVFQTLGYVESQDGEVQAIVADGSGTYLVKQGEIFADQYQAISVDPILVLAVKVPPVKPALDFLSAHTDSDTKPASKRLYGYLPSPLSGSTGILPMGSLGQDGQATLGANLGVNLFNTLSTELDVQSHFYTTDNLKLRY
jgi:hypothetical protein